MDFPDNETRNARALRIALQYGGFDGSHHKMWAIDQIVRALTGCPIVTEVSKDIRGQEYAFQAQGESDEYLEWVRRAKDGDDGPDTYDWDLGCPP